MSIVLVNYTNNLSKSEYCIIEKEISNIANTNVKPLSFEIDIPHIIHNLEHKFLDLVLGHWSDQPTI